MLLTVLPESAALSARAKLALARATLKALGANTLLSGTNPKTDKSVKFGYLTAVMHFAPARLSGYEVCPGRSAGCTRACLHTAGNIQHLAGKRKARIARTRFYFRHPELFKLLLTHELSVFVRQADELGLKACARLNATSDIVWEVKFPEVFAKFPNVQFYDYTKLAGRFNRALPSNYHLTFSRSEDNQADVQRVLGAGGSVAVVFSGCGISRFPKPFPTSYIGHGIVNGDEHDLRFLDAPNSIVGLRAKGKAIGSHSGFVVAV